jgi:hypothetical protein
MASLSQKIELIINSFQGVSITYCGPTPFAFDRRNLDVRNELETGLANFIPKTQIVLRLLN